MKYVINKCYGGFGLSEKAFEWLIKRKNWKVTNWKNGNYEDQSAQIVLNTTSPETTLLGKYSLVDSCHELKLRCNTDLVECVEILKEDANGRFAELEVVTCPYSPSEGIEIDEYDGIETLQVTPERW